MAPVGSTASPDSFSNFGVVSYSYRHAGPLTGIACPATSPPTMCLLELLYATSLDDHLGFEPGGLLGWQHSCVLRDARCGIMQKGKMEKREVAGDQSKLSRTSPLSRRARTLHDEDGHRTAPWWHLAQSRGQPGGGEEKQGAPPPGPFSSWEATRKPGTAGCAGGAGGTAWRGQLQGRARSSSSPPRRQHPRPSRSRMSSAGGHSPAPAPRAGAVSSAANAAEQAERAHQMLRRQQLRAGTPITSLVVAPVTARGDGVCGRGYSCSFGAVQSTAAPAFT